MTRPGAPVLRRGFLPFLILLAPLFSWGRNPASADGAQWSATARWLDSSEVRGPASRTHADSGEARTRYAETRGDGAEDGEKARGNDVELHGVKSLEVGVGDGVSMQQGLRLELKGTLEGGTRIEGELLDQDMPVGDGGRSASLREMDWMWVRLSRDSSWFLLGDGRLEFGARGDLHRFEREQQGAAFGIATRHVWSEGSWGSARARWRRVELRMADGVSEGYDLGLEGPDLKVAPGTVSVRVNGRLLDASEYSVDGMSGTIDFLGSRLPSSLDRVVVEFQEVDDLEPADMGHFALGLRAGTWGIEGGLAWSRLPEADPDSASAEDEAADVPEAMLHARATAPLGPGGFVSFEWARSLPQLDSRAAADCDTGCGDGLQWRWRSPEKAFFVWSGEGRRIDGFRPWGALDEAYAFRTLWDVEQDSLRNYWLNRQTVEAPLGAWTLELGGDFLQRRADAEAENLDVALGRVGARHSTPLAEQRSYAEWGRWDEVGKEERDRLRASGEVAWKRGFWRPNGSARADWWREGGERRARHLDAEAGWTMEGRRWTWNASGEARLRQEATERSWRDSLRQSALSQEFVWRSDAHEFGASGSWLRGVAAGERSEFTGADLHWNAALPEGGSWSSHAGWKRSFSLPLVRSYKKVPRGSGNVVYDSTSGRWVEGVDLGDWRFDGWTRDTTAARQLRFVAAWGARLSLPLALLPFAGRGILNDLSLGAHADWEGADTSGRGAWTEPTVSALRSLSEGRWTRGGSLNWSSERLSASAGLSFDATASRVSGDGGGDNRSNVWSADAHKGWNEAWFLDLAVSRGSERRDGIEWEENSADAAFRRAVGSWRFGPLWSVVESSGDDSGAEIRATRIAPGADVEWKAARDCRIFAEHRAHVLWRGPREVPWEMSDGYRRGLTHRTELGIRLELADALTLQGSWVAKFRGDEFRHKLALEGRGVF